jgi:hypothetical protein
LMTAMSWLDHVTLTVGALSLLKLLLAEYVQG